MCGLAGYVNVPPSHRFALSLALGLGTDERGGHAAGYVSVAHDGAAHPIRYGRRRGTWGGASVAFVRDASARADLSIIHSRYATCGDRDDASQAHPFAIRRGGRTVLWGAHNGMIEGTRASARLYDRDWTVDSREAFELLADGKLSDLADLSGYGTLTWIERDAPDRVRLVRLTDDGALEIGRTTCGAVVWASTMAILVRGLVAAGMQLQSVYATQAGEVYEAHVDGRLTLSEAYATGVTVSERWTYTPATIASRWIGSDAVDDTPEHQLDGECPGPCPYCKSIDTWAGAGEGQCETCGFSFDLDTEDVPANDAYDGPAFDRWIERERERARSGATSPDEAE